MGGKERFAKRQNNQARAVATSVVAQPYLVAVRNLVALRVGRNAKVFAERGLGGSRSAGFNDRRRV